MTFVEAIKRCCDYDTYVTRPEYEGCFIVGVVECEVAMVSLNATGGIDDWSVPPLTYDDVIADDWETVEPLKSEVK